MECASRKNRQRAPNKLQRDTLENRIVAAIEAADAGA
jgi:hypothetical protein